MLMEYVPTGDERDVLSQWFQTDRTITPRLWWPFLRNILGGERHPHVLLHKPICFFSTE